MIKAVILDFYGVIQSEEVLIWCDKNSAEHPGLREKVDEVSAQIDLNLITLDQYFEELAKMVGRPTEQVRHELRDEVTIDRNLLSLIDDFRAKGIKTAILSNDGPSLRGYLNQHNITPHFDHIFISGELNMMKPDVRIYQHAAQELMIHPAQIIFFDDRQTNVDGALAAGFQAQLYKSISQVRQLLTDLL